MPVAVLRRRMTRKEFWSWLAFARMYPVIEHEPPDFANNRSLTADELDRIKNRKGLGYG